MLWILLAVFGLPLLWWIIMCHRAPYGYEDATGFHYGQPGDGGVK